MAETSKGQANMDTSLSLKDLILRIKEWKKYILSKWVVILIAGIIGGAIGLGYSLYKKPTYVASLSFALEDDKASGGLGSASGLASQFGLDLGGSGGGAFAGDNLLELMKSRSMIQNTLLTTISLNNKQTTLVELYISYNKYREKWNNDARLAGLKFLPGTDPTKLTIQQDSVLGGFYRALIKNNLVVSKIDKKLSIINVNVVSENELFSKLFAEILVQRVSDFYIQTKTKKSVQNVGILQHQTDSVRRQLNSAIGGVATSVDVNPNPNPLLAMLKVPSQRKGIDVQTNTVILTELVKQLEIAKVSLRKETPLIQIIDKPILPLEKERLGKLKAIVLGGTFAIIVMLISLTFGRFYKQIMSDES